MTSLTTDVFKSKYSRGEKALMALFQGPRFLSQLGKDLGLHSLSGLQRDLEEFERKGLVTSEMSKGLDGRSRRYYETTWAGLTHIASIQLAEAGYWSPWTNED